MSEVTVEVLTAAPDVPGASPTPYDLLTLAEAKTFLGITDTSKDAQISMWITMASLTIAEMCNRVFAYEEVRETWFCLASNSLYLTRWPVKAEDIESITENGTPTDPTSYTLEEKKGHLLKPSGWTVPIVIIYWGGYHLPDEAPADLKFAAAILIQEMRAQSLVAQMSGIRMLSHKSARVMFYDPSKAAQMAKSGAAYSPAETRARALLSNYTRYWV
jgi:hypothetical protein